MRGVKISDGCSIKIYNLGYCSQSHQKILSILRTFFKKELIENSFVSVFWLSESPYHPLKQFFFLFFEKNIVSHIWLKKSSFLTSIFAAAPRATLGQYWGDSLTHLMLVTVFLQIWGKGHQEACNEVGSLSQTKHLVVFEARTLWFYL